MFAPAAAPQADTENFLALNGNFVLFDQEADLSPGSAEKTAIQRAQLLINNLYPL